MWNKNPASVRLIGHEWCEARFLSRLWLVLHAHCQFLLSCFAFLCAVSINSTDRQGVYAYVCAIAQHRLHDEGREIHASIHPSIHTHRCVQE